MSEQAVLTIRERVAGAGRQIARVKRLDRVARAVIVLGGLAVVVSVLGILLFIGAEAFPLFRAARVDLAGSIDRGDAAPALAVGADEHLTYLYEIRADGTLAFFRVKDGQLDRTLPLAGLEGAVASSASRTFDDAIAVGTEDGRVALTSVQFERRYEGEQFTGVDVTLESPRIVALDPGKRPLHSVTYRRSDGGGRAVAAVAGADLLLWTESADGTVRTQHLPVPAGEVVTSARLGGIDRLVAGTKQGRVYHWELGDEPRLTDVSPVSAQPITALEWILGDETFIAGTEGGELSAWFRTRLQDEDEDQAMVRAHSFPSQAVAVTGLAVSARDRSFVSVGADGSMVLRHTTSERTLATLPGGGRAARAVMLSPKADAAFVVRDDGVTRYTIHSPHPEITLRALFGKTWYEGYSRPDHVWQSTGGTNDFEPKFDLFPLVFGTMKGTVYALLFAVPIAVMAALYTSQFAHPKVRDRVKPAVEIMAALPSVVIGFLAGLWLASLIERVLVSTLLMFVLLPVAGTAGVFLWRALPRSMTRRLRPGTEVLLILPLLVFAGWIALQIGPAIEAAAFGGDFKTWLATTFGLTYDQRNCLVVGLAMGFAVIPIIFTISEDAFSNVPSNLTAASLALGASRWQTALRVVLPTASPGVFSAVMVGFGRAVGETMIVLMATGNTPVLDWSIFNGMRTLAANIATEIPEAPHGDTLYRVLFLSAALLFAITFTVNTVAELIRQRLRQRYRAL